MKRLNILIIFGLLIIPAYASAEPVPPNECPCDTLNIGETNGAEILAEICPSGQLAPDAEFIFNEEIISVSLDDPIRGYRAGLIGPMGSPGCGLNIGPAGVSAGISELELQSCRIHILESCGLGNTRPIPTLSEWGLIAMAGLLGFAGLVVARRKRAAV